MRPLIVLPAALLAACLAQSALAAEPDYHAMADSAVADLVNNYWTGDATTGHIRPSWGGTPTKEMRTPIWEMGTFVFAVDNLYQTSHDPVLKQRIRAEWRFLQRWHPPKDMTAVGEGTLQNALDDAMTAALVCLTVYRDTEETQCLFLAKDLVNHAWVRWHDNALGGALWYRDIRDVKADWNAEFALVALRLYEITGERVYWDRALEAYQWVERSLLRPDGLYYRYMRPDGSMKATIAASPRENREDTGLLGNTLMGVLHARLYRDTGSKEYLVRALRTAQAVRTHETDSQGCLVNEGDGWMDGVFIGEWASEVLSLPGIAPEDQTALRKTAVAITTRDRTPDGHYGPCWNGPLGAGCPWDDPKRTYARATPDQTATSSGAVNVVAAAAALDVRRPWPAPRKPPAR